MEHSTNEVPYLHYLRVLAHHNPLLHRSVTGGSFSYYTLAAPAGSSTSSTSVDTLGVGLRLRLISHQGDADIYISSGSGGDGVATYRNYAYKSDSCGVDVVDLPPGFPRPASIGVYGHPSFMGQHNFTLEVYSLEPGEGGDSGSEFGVEGETYEALAKTMATSYHQDGDDAMFSYHEQRMSNENSGSGQSAASSSASGEKKRRSKKSGDRGASSQGGRGGDKTVPPEIDGFLSLLRAIVLGLVEILFDVLL